MSNRSSLTGTKSSGRDIQSSLLNSSKIYGRGGGTSNDRTLISTNQVYSHAYTKPQPFKRMEAYSKSSTKAKESNTESKEQSDVSVTIDEETRKQMLEDQERLNDEITQLKKENKNKDDDIMSLRQTISEFGLLKQNYDTLQQQYLDLQNEKNQIQADYSIVIKQIELLDNQTGNKDSIIADQSSQIEKLTTSIVSDQQYYQQNESELNHTIENHADERKQLQNQVDTLTQKILVLEQDIANSEESVKMKIDNLELQITTLTTQNQEYLTTIADYKNIINQLQIEIEKLNVQIADNIKDINTKSNELKRIPELLNEIEEKKITINNYEIQINDLQSKQADSETIIKKNELLVEEIQSQLNELTQNHSSYQQNTELLTTLQNQYNELNTKYMNLQKEYDTMSLDYKDTKMRNESAQVLEHIKELKEKDIANRKIAVAESAPISLDPVDDDDMMMMDVDEDDGGVVSDVPTNNVSVVEDEPINIPDKNADDSLWTYETHKEINRQMYSLQYDRIALSNKEKHTQQQLDVLKSEYDVMMKAKNECQTKLEQCNKQILDSQNELSSLQTEYNKLKEEGDYDTIIELKNKINDLEVKIQQYQIDKEAYENKIQAINLEKKRDPEVYNKKIYDANDCIPLREYKSHELLKIRDDATLQNYENRIFESVGDSNAVDKYKQFMDSHSELSMLTLEDEIEQRGKEIVALNNEILYYENLDTLLNDNDNERIVLKETIKNIYNKINYVNNELCLTKNYLLTMLCDIQVYRCQTLNTALIEMDESGYKIDLLTTDPKELQLIRDTINNTLTKCEDYMKDIQYESIRYRHETIDYAYSNNTNLITNIFCDADHLHLHDLLYSHCDNIFDKVVTCDYNSLSLACKMFKTIQYNSQTEVALNRYISLHSMLSHPCIEKLYGVVKTPTLGFLTEMHTASLQEMLDLVYKGKTARFSFTFEMMIRMCNQIACVIQYLHTQKPPIIHGRLHPNNIYVDEYLNVTIADPFLDYLYQDLNIPNHRQHYNQAYIPPEVINGSLPTIQSDIYSLNLIIYDIFTGVVTKSPEPLNWKESVTTSDLQPQLIDVISSSLNENPTIRSSLQDLLDKFEYMILQNQNKRDNNLYSGKSFIRKPGNKIEKA